MQVLWYYTTAKRLQEILAAGELRPATMGRSRKEKPAVWFSAHPEWDAAANEPWQAPDGSVARLNKDQTYVLGGGLARIGVAPEDAPHDWKAFKQLSGISPKIAKEIYNAAVQAGSRPGQWFASFEAIPQSKWLATEILEGDAWVARAV
ncbi:MAG: hypothetical protein JXB62_10940 [Pirellulales bacterium]|nr:hypothetical protein [Pirellulales bacterium]